MRIEIVDVTPELAAQWLKFNTHNRNIRRRAVADYARDMAAGNWALNGESLKRSLDGTILDGQHRLMAVVASGATVTMLVVHDLPPETQETMDAGSKRTASDVFSLRGETNAVVLAAVLQRVWMWENGDHKFSRNYSATKAECSKLLGDRPEIHRSVEEAVRIHRSFRYLPQSVTGTAHHLFSRISPDEAVWFFARVGNGADLPESHPVLTLRQRVMSDRSDGKRLPDHRVMAYLIRSWNAVRDGREMSRIQHANDGPMPMPK